LAIKSLKDQARRIAANIAKLPELWRKAARAELAAENAEANRKARLERQEQIARQTRDIEFASIRSQLARQQNWQNNVQAAARNAVAYQQRATLLGELEKALTPPVPPLEPDAIEVIERDPLGSPNFFDDDYNVNYYADKFAGKTKR